MSQEDIARAFGELQFRRTGLFPRTSGYGIAGTARSALERSEEELPQSYRLGGFLDSMFMGLQRDVESSFERTNHIAGIRSIPDRLSTIGASTGLLSSDGSNVAEHFGDDGEAVAKASKWLNHLTGGAYELELIRLNDRAVEFLGDQGALVLRDTRLKTNVAFKDVGVGLSQVLPILALLARSRRGHKSGLRRSMGMSPIAEPLLLLEQPELHLHPRMQAELTDLLIEGSCSGGQTRLTARDRNTLGEHGASDSTANSRRFAKSNWRVHFVCISGQASRSLRSDKASH